MSGAHSVTSFRFVPKVWVCFQVLDLLVCIFAERAELTPLDFSAVTKRRSYCVGYNFWFLESSEFL